MTEPAADLHGWRLFRETSDLVASLRAYGLTQAVLAAATGVSERTVRAWEGSVSLRQRHEDRLRDLAEVVGILSQSLTSRGVSQWLTARNRTLDGIRPVEAIRKGDRTKALIAARALVDGGYA